MAEPDLRAEVLAGIDQQLEDFNGLICHPHEANQLAKLQGALLAALRHLREIVQKHEDSGAARSRADRIGLHDWDDTHRCVVAARPTPARPCSRSPPTTPIIATIVVNGLANALPLNNQSTGEISDSFLFYFVPAGYVFAICGLIYLGLLAFGIYQALPAQRENPRLRKVGYLFVLSCAANIIWLFLWHYNFFVLTLAAMITLLVCLILIYERLGNGRLKVSAAEFWAVQVPFSIYLGWVTVATIANFTDVLYDVGWNGFGIDPQICAVIIGSKEYEAS